MVQLIAILIGIPTGVAIGVFAIVTHCYRDNVGLVTKKIKFLYVIMCLLMVTLGAFDIYIAVETYQTIRVEKVKNT